MIEKRLKTVSGRELVVALADALGEPHTEALTLAGYASEKPRNKTELFRALARLGVFEATFEEGALDNLIDKTLILSPAASEESVNRVRCCRTPSENLQNSG